MTGMGGIVGFDMTAVLAIMKLKNCHDPVIFDLVQSAERAIVREISGKKE